MANKPTFRWSPKFVEYDVIWRSISTLYGTVLIKYVNLRLCSAYYWSLDWLQKETLGAEDKWTIPDDIFY